MTSDPPRLRSARICFVQTLAVLALGLFPWPEGWTRVHSAMESARSHEMNRTDREVNAGGYYQSLIGVDGPDGGPAELALRLLGKPKDWVRFRAAAVSHDIDHDHLMFELLPNVDKPLFGVPFTTNRFGMRDREFTVEKPPGTFRVAVLGSSIDMGWGVASEATYVKRLEVWLNAHAARRGLRRRFEVLNFAVAAYCPMQRLEAFRRKAARFDPDLVIYSATMLDVRLIEIHLCDLFQCRVEPGFGFIHKAIADAGITEADLLLDFRPDGKDRLREKDLVKQKLRPQYWPLYDATMQTLAADCRSMGIPLACVIVPRVGKADAPDARGEMVATLTEMLGRHADAVFDLSGTFDHLDPAKLELAAWDDHPNALAHRRLFLTLARGLVGDKLYATLFPPEQDEGHDPEAR